MAESKRSLRCWLGFHKWKRLGFTSAIDVVVLNRCERCGIGEEASAYGTSRYTKAAMDKILDEKGATGCE